MVGKREELIEFLISVGYLKSPNIINAFKTVPRELFVPSEYANYAYDDIPLPIGRSSTISQPSTVAIMLEFLEPKENEMVLEIGAGSGWQACLLASCVGKKGKVVTIEIDKFIADLARRNIAKTGSRNTEVIEGDGSVGYSKGAPFDKIIYTAAVPEVPKVVLDQLKVKGTLVAPVGNEFIQILKIINKTSEKSIKEKDFGSFLFVPLKGKFGFKIDNLL